MNNETNDQRIMLLKKQIESKKAQLSKSTRFSPVTNCSLEVDAVRYNIQVLARPDLISLMVKLNSYMMSAKNLDVLDDYVISGYKVEDWIADIKARIAILSHKLEENRLKLMEDKLIKLLSDGKKVELELNEIESILS